MRSKEQTNARDGVVAGLAAYALWGFLPVYFKLVDTVDPLEILVHRVIWAVGFGAVILFIRRQWSDVKMALANRTTLAWLSISSLMITLNWLIFIWAIVDERIFEASLGYYINPLTAMLAGVLFFGEKFRHLQLWAVALAFIGVLILTVQGGKLPWVSLVLAITFTFYASIRKQVVIGGMPGLFIETLLILPLAAIWLAWITANGQAAFAGGDGEIMFLLILSGPITVVPLLLFAVAARRVTMTALGFMQFLAPTIQFGIAMYYGETLTTAHILCFSFIWTAVIIFSIDAVRASRKPQQRRPARA